MLGAILKMLIKHPPLEHSRRDAKQLALHPQIIVVQECLVLIQPALPCAAAGSFDPSFIVCSALVAALSRPETRGSHITWHSSKFASDFSRLELIQGSL